MVDQQMLNDLKAASYPNTLGKSFWWPSISVKGSKGTARYGLGPNNSSDFLSQAMIDFTKTTKKSARLSSQK
ncbi:MAG: hypothetical protein FJZ56_05155 [Chlamydiae bacterium]|nr:hypothetical protein [Chlamydiota bacterium]